MSLFTKRVLLFLALSLPLNCGFQSTDPLSQLMLMGVELLLDSNLFVE